MCPTHISEASQFPPNWKLYIVKRIRIKKKKLGKDISENKEKLIQKMVMIIKGAHRDKTAERCNVPNYSVQNFATITLGDLLDVLFFRKLENIIRRKQNIHYGWLLQILKLKIAFSFFICEYRLVIFDNLQFIYLPNFRYIRTQICILQGSISSWYFAPLIFFKFQFIVMFILILLGSFRLILNVISSTDS